MFLVWCSLKIDSYFFAVMRFGFSVLAATGNENAESFDARASIKPGTRNIPNISDVPCDKTRNTEHSGMIVKTKKNFSRRKIS